LKDFPSYQVHLERFIDKFEPDEGIGLANMALSNAARIAMQTPIYTWLLETPCERWHVGICSFVPRGAFSNSQRLV
jgi:hypothetical protein